jgi:NAD(P)-dependent dehydrogenase (short-subunit alcohol dehydrogenase family)
MLGKGCMTTQMENNMTGRVCIVTGATSGIGREIARNLAAHGATVVLACRNEVRGRAAMEEIVRATGNRHVHAMPVDLSRQSSIRCFARRFLATFPALHVLVNNAGVFLPERHVGVDGIEMTWATNVLGYHLLSQLLLERLKASAPARVVNVASTFADGLDLTDPEFHRRHYDGVTAYRQSKQANRMLTWALAERLAGTGVTANAVHPGGVATGIYRELRGLRGALVRGWVRIIKTSPRKGADTPTWLATSAELANMSGKFWASRREVPCIFRDRSAIERLWELCEKMVTETGSAHIDTSGSDPKREMGIIGRETA